MSEIKRFVPLMAVYSGFNGEVPPQYSRYQTAPDGLEIGDGIVRDDIGVRWFIPESEKPRSIPYVNIYMDIAPYPNYDPLYRARGLADYGILGILDIAESDKLEERKYNGEAEHAKIESVMLFCRPFIKGHDFATENEDYNHKSRRMIEHDKPMQGRGSLIITRNGVLMPFCPDGPQEHETRIEYGGRKFMLVSPLKIVERTVTFEAPYNEGYVHDALGKLTDEQDKYAELLSKKTQARRARVQTVVDETIDTFGPDTIYDFSNVADQIPDAPPPGLHGRALKRYWKAQEKNKKTQQ